MEAVTKFFELEKRHSNVKIELIAGLTTFLAMAYIIFVNPAILSDAGMDKQALIIVTCLISGLATIATGIFVKAPIAMAPGMGLNAFFVYSLVLNSDKKIDFQTALGIVFLSGLIFFILSIIGIREKLVKAIPKAVVDATSVGIGLFIAFIGFKNLGLIADHPATLVTLGNIKSTTVLIGLVGLILIVVLEAKKIRGSILIGIIFSTVLALIFKQVKFPAMNALFNTNFSIAPVFLKLNIMGALKWSFIGAIFSMMFVDMFDSVGTIIACSKEADMVNEDGSIEKVGPLLTMDAAATMTGAVLGTSTTTSYIESGAGIEAGGRTGLTSVVTGILFLLSIPFVSLIGIVPGYATAPALIIVGLFMLKRVKDIYFTEIDNALPAFLTIILMPLTYSISTGLAFGFISYTLIKVLLGKFKDVEPLMWIVTVLSVMSLVV